MSTRGEAGKRDQFSRIAAFLGGHQPNNLLPRGHVIGLQAGVSTGDEPLALDLDDTVRPDLAILLHKHDVTAPWLMPSEGCDMKHLAVSDCRVHAMAESFEAERNSGACQCLCHVGEQCSWRAAIFNR